MTSLIDPATGPEDLGVAPPLPPEQQSLGTVLTPDLPHQVPAPAADIGDQDAGLPPPPLPSELTSSEASASSVEAGSAIHRVEVFTEPWVEHRPAIVGVVVDNPSTTNRSVVATARLEQDGSATTSSASQPTLVPAGARELLNVTLSAPRGSYTLNVTIHEAGPAGALGDGLDQVSQDAVVSMPLDLPASAYVRVVEDGTSRPAGHGEVASGNRNVTVDPEGGSAGCCTVEVYQPWLEHVLGGVTTTMAWATVVDAHGPWARATVAQGSAVTFQAFEPTVGQRVFTQGADPYVALSERPMWVEVVEQRSTIEEEVTLEGPDGPVTTTNVTLDPHLEVAFEDGDETGQTLAFNAAWLREVGFTRLVFSYADGEVIPAERVGEVFLVHAPHFSSVMVDDYECDPQICTDGLHGWTVIDAGEHFETVNIGDTPSSGDYALWAEGGSSSNHAEGVRDLSLIAPDEVSFWAQVATPHSPPDWHQVRLLSGGEIALRVTLVSDTSTTYKVSSSNSKDDSSTDANGKFPDSFPVNVWRQVVFENLDWSACTYSLRVAGVLLTSGLSMESGCTAGTSDTIDEVMVGSKGWNAEAWFVDNIRYDYLPQADQIGGQERFELGFPSSWLATDDWHRSDCRASEGSWSMRWAASSSCSSGLDPNELGGVLISHEFDVPSVGGNLWFSTWWDTRTGDADLKVVRLSERSPGGQNSNWREIGLITPRDVPIQSWSDVGVDLSPWAGTRVAIEWLFDPVDTGGSTSDEGWYVDNVRIPGSPPVITLDNPVDNQPVYGTVRIEGTAYDPDGGDVTLCLSIDWGSCITPQTSGIGWWYDWDTCDEQSDGTCANPGPSTHTVSVDATDNDGTTRNALASGVEVVNDCANDCDLDVDGLINYFEWKADASVFGVSSCDMVDMDARSGTHCPHPEEPDIYLEVDWMHRPPYSCFLILTCGDYSMQPTSAQIDPIVQAFDAQGINVHVDTGQLGGGNEVPWLEELPFGRISGQADFLDYKWGGDGVASQFDTANRFQVWHYTIMGYRYAENPDSSGRGEVEGDDFFVSYGWIKEGGFDYDSFDTAIAGTIIHELGHNLCLTGQTASSTDCEFIWIDDEGPVEYESSMNYRYQMLMVDYSDGSNGANDHDDWGGIHPERFQDPSQAGDGLSAEESDKQSHGPVADAVTALASQGDPG